MWPGQFAHGDGRLRHGRGPKQAVTKARASITNWRICSIFDGSLIFHRRSAPTPQACRSMGFGLAAGQRPGAAPGNSGFETGPEVAPEIATLRRSRLAPAPASATIAHPPLLQEQAQLTRFFLPRHRSTRITKAITDSRSRPCCPGLFDKVMLPSPPSTRRTGLPPLDERVEPGA